MSRASVAWSWWRKQRYPDYLYVIARCLVIQVTIFTGPIPPSIIVLITSISCWNDVKCEGRVDYDAIMIWSLLCWVTVVGQRGPLRETLTVAGLLLVKLKHELKHMIRTLVQKSVIWMQSRVIAGMIDDISAPPTRMTQSREGTDVNRVHMDV
jgi:hypothetical protein